MNKNLEKEYKELIAENAPDLWERIEAGLEPKQLTAEKNNLWRRYRMWGFAVAACLCMMVTVPIILRKNTDGSMQSDSAPYFDVGMADGNLNAVENAGDSLEPPSYDSSMTDGNLNATENAGDLFEAYSTEDAAATYTLMGTVTEISEKEGRRVYIVDVFRTDLTELSDDSITLYSDRAFSEEVLEGEKYLFDISISIDNNGIREYLIEDIW